MAVPQRTGMAWTTAGRTTPTTVTAVRLSPGRRWTRFAVTAAMTTTRMMTGRWIRWRLGDPREYGANTVRETLAVPGPGVPRHRRLPRRRRWRSWWAKTTMTTSAGRRSGGRRKATPPYVAGVVCGGTRLPVVVIGSRQAIEPGENSAGTLCRTRDLRRTNRLPTNIGVTCPPRGNALNDGRWMPNDGNFTNNIYCNRFNGGWGRGGRKEAHDAFGSKTCGEHVAVTWRCYPPS